MSAKATRRYNSMSRGATIQHCLTSHSNYPCLSSGSEYCNSNKSPWECYVCCSWQDLEQYTHTNHTSNIYHSNNRLFLPSNHPFIKGTQSFFLLHFTCTGRVRHTGKEATYVGQLFSFLLSGSSPILWRVNTPQNDTPTNMTTQNCCGAICTERLLFPTTY